MRMLSNTDFALAVRLLEVYSRYDWATLKEQENARKARMLLKKWRKTPPKAARKQQ